MLGKAHLQDSCRAPVRIIHRCCCLPAVAQAKGARAIRCWVGGWGCSLSCTREGQGSGALQRSLAADPGSWRQGEGGGSLEMSISLAIAGWLRRSQLNAYCNAAASHGTSPAAPVATASSSAAAVALSIAAVRKFKSKWIDLVRLLRTGATELRCSAAVAPSCSGGRGHPWATLSLHRLQAKVRHGCSALEMLTRRLARWENLSMDLFVAA